MTVQKVDLYQPIAAARPGAPPLVLRIATAPRVEEMVGGPISNPVKIENYVLLSALPEELRQRVTTAVQALLSMI